LTPLSRKVGTFGSIGERVSPVPVIARTLPSSICAFSAA